MKNKEYVELVVKYDVYDTSSENKLKKPKLIKKGVPVKISCNPKEDLFCPSQVLDKKGRIVKKECSVIIRERGQMIVNHSYDDVVKMIWGNNEEKNNQIGFKLNKNYERKK